MWEPDNHSRPSPIWGPCEPDLADLSRSVCADLGIGFGPVAIVERNYERLVVKADAAENSKNMRILPAGLVVKKLPAGEQDRYRRRMALLPALQDLFPSHLGEAHGCVVLRYVGGTSFVDATDLGRVAARIAWLRHTLSHVPADGIEAIAYETDLGAPTLAHIDLHAHNVMVGPYGVTIMDLASLYVVPEAIQTGYAMYKLCRQAIVSGMAPLTAVRIFVHHARVKYPRLALAAATSEIRRRLAYIAAEEAKGHTGWIEDRARHLQALQEIDWLRQNLVAGVEEEAECET
jgi:hypothetical protein